MLAGLAGVLAADNLIHPGIVKSIAGILTGGTGSVATASLSTADKSEEGGQLPGIGVPASVVSVIQAGQATPQPVPDPVAPVSAQPAVDTASEYRAISDSRQKMLQETAAVLSGEADASSQRAETRREIIPSVKTQQELFRSFQSYLKSTGNAEITDHRTQEELFRKFIRWSVESPPGN